MRLIERKVDNKIKNRQSFTHFRPKRPLCIESLNGKGNNVFALSLKHIHGVAINSNRYLYSPICSIDQKILGNNKLVA